MNIYFYKAVQSRKHKKPTIYKFYFLYCYTINVFQSPKHTEETLKSKQIFNTYQFLPMIQDLPAVNLYVNPVSGLLSAHRTDFWDTEILPFPEARLSDTSVFQTEINDEGEGISPTVWQSRGAALPWQSSWCHACGGKENHGCPKALQGVESSTFGESTGWICTRTTSPISFCSANKCNPNKWLSLWAVRHTLRIHSRELNQCLNYRKLNC